MLQCQCVSECPVKCEDSRSRHSHLAAFTDSSHSPNVGFPFTRRPPCCKIQQITFTTLMDPHINMQICKRPTFSQRISFWHFCFYFHPLSSLDNVCKGCGTFTVVHFWLLVFLSRRVAFHVLPLQVPPLHVPPPPLAGKHNDEQKCGGRDDGNRNIGCTLKTKTLVRLKKKYFKYCTVRPSLARSTWLAPTGALVAMLRWDRPADQASSYYWHTTATTTAASTAASTGILLKWFL